jgi:hypothetical protein
MRHGAKVKQCSSEGCTNIKLSKEECALGMGKRSKSINASLKDAQIEPSKEECA